MMAMALHGMDEELEAMERYLGTLREVAPQVASMAQASWGEDVGGVAVHQDPTLEARGKRGVAADGESLRVGVGGETKPDLLLEEAAHVVQHRNRERGGQRADGSVARLESDARGAVDAARAGRKGRPERAANQPLYQDDTTHQPEQPASGRDQQVEAQIGQALADLEVLRSDALSRAEELAWPAVEAQYSALRTRLEALQTGFVERASAMRRGQAQSQAQQQVHEQQGSEAHAEEELQRQVEKSTDLERLCEQALAALAQIPVVVEPILERGRYETLLEQKQQELFAQAQQMRADIDQRAQKAEARAEDSDKAREAVAQARQAALARVDEVEGQLLEGIDALAFARRELLSVQMTAAAERLGAMRDAGELVALTEEVQQSASQHERQLDAASTRVDLAYTRFTVVVDHQASAESVEQRVDPLGLVAEVVFIKAGDGSGEGQEVVTIPDHHTAKLAEQIARLEGFRQLTIETMVEGIKSQDPTNLDNLAMAALPFALGPILGASSKLKNLARIEKLVERAGENVGDIATVAKSRGMDAGEADELAALVKEAQGLDKGKTLSPDKETRLKTLFEDLDTRLGAHGSRAAGVPSMKVTFSKERHSLERFMKGKAPLKEKNTILLRDVDLADVNDAARQAHASSGAGIGRFKNQDVEWEFQVKYSDAGNKYIHIYPTSSPPHAVNLSRDQAKTVQTYAQMRSNKKNPLSHEDALAKVKGFVVSGKPGFAWSAETEIVILAGMRMF